MKTTKPPTIKEAIEELQTFLECDLYTKFRPEVKFPGTERVYERRDSFKNEKDMLDYLRGHFKILKKSIGNIENEK